MKTTMLAVIGTLMFAGFVQAQTPPPRTGRFMVGAFGGYNIAIPFARGALSGEHDFEIPDTQNGWDYSIGGEFGYMFANGYGIGIEFEQVKTRVYAESMDNATIFNSRSYEAMIDFRWQTIPFDWKGFSFHVSCALGFAINAISRGPAAYAISSDVNIRAPSSFAMDGGIGFAYYFTPWFSFEVDAKINILVTPMRWTAMGESLNISEWVYGSGQFVGGPRFWF